MISRNDVWNVAAQISEYFSMLNATYPYYDVDLATELLDGMRADDAMDYLLRIANLWDIALDVDSED